MQALTINLGAGHVVFYFDAINELLSSKITISW